MSPTQPKLEPDSDGSPFLTTGSASCKQCSKTLCRGCWEAKAIGTECCAAQRAIILFEVSLAVLLGNKRSSLVVDPIGSLSVGQSIPRRPPQEALDFRFRGEAKETRQTFRQRRRNRLRIWTTSLQRIQRSEWNTRIWLERSSITVSRR